MPRRLPWRASPGPDDLEGNAGSSPGQFHGVDEPPSFVFSSGSFRLTFENIVEPNLGSRNAIDPLPDIFFPAKHNRTDLIFVVWRYLRDDIGGIQFHHAVDQRLNPFFLAVRRQVPLIEGIQPLDPLLGLLLLR